MGFGGQDDGYIGLAGARGLGEAKLLESRAQALAPKIEAPRWHVGSVLRVLGIIVLAIVLTGWALTLLNA